MNAYCIKCSTEYDDARCTTICPHEAFLTVGEATQKDLAISLLGRRVYFAHRPAGVAAVRVSAVRWDGMVELEGWSGEFAPHCFVLVD